MTDLSRFLSAASFAVPRRRAGADWDEHLPFLAWVVATARPSCIVCLAGEPVLAAACDAAAIAGLDCRTLGPCGATADPDWLDEHRAMAVLQAGLGPHALLPGSVGLLLLGRDDDAAVWQDRLAPGAVVLQAGGATEGPGGVAFWHGRGLGVQVQPGAAPALQALAEADPALLAATRDAYARLGGHLTTRAQLRAARDALAATAARPAVAGPSALSALLPGQLAQSRAREAAALAQAHEMQRALRIMRESTSWRLTAPLRGVMHRVPGLRRRLRAGLRLGWWTLTLQLGRRLAAERGAARPGLAAPTAAGAWPPPLPLAPALAPQRPACPVAVVVCVHNALEDVARCLDSLAAHGRAGMVVVLVDDGSDAPTRDLLATRALDLGATLIRHEAALGYTRAANAGLRAASAELVVLLNSDTVVTAGWLDALQRVFDADSRTAIAGPLSNTASWQSVPLLSQEGPDGTDWAENARPPGLTVEAIAAMLAEPRAQHGSLHPALPFVNGFCLVLRASALAQIGLLDEAGFPTGYGEENDLCIRARKAGWTLRIAEDAYVWHAQSRSFSHERRRVLSERAGAALAARHDQARDVDGPAGFCRDSLAMLGLRSWVGGRLEREQLRAIGRAHAGRRIAIVLPVAAEGGGANVVLQEAQALAAMGVSVALLNLRRNRPGALAAYPETTALWTFLEDEAAVADAIRRGGYDAAVATAHQSAYWLPLQEEVPDCRLAYYVQDYEPLFYDPLDPEHALARGSYLQDPRRLLLTKTLWNRDILRDQVGVEAVPLGPSLDVDRFRPVDRAGWEAPAPTLRVCAMVRPSSARRAPEDTWRLLAEASGRHGRALECHVFGADEAEVAGYRERFPGAVRNHGRLRRDQVAALFRAMDVFVDLSSYQAMGLSLLEAMASGLAVVGPLRGGAGELVQDGADGFLVPTQTVEPAAALLDRMATGALDLGAVRRAAVIAAHRHTPERPALAMLEALFG